MSEEEKPKKEPDKKKLVDDQNRLVLKLGDDDSALVVRNNGEIELIRDQISLPKGNASIEDLLLQQKEIATDFQSQFRVGLSYTFGSVFNNIINSRL